MSRHLRSRWPSHPKRRSRCCRRWRPPRRGSRCRGKKQRLLGTEKRRLLRRTRPGGRLRRRRWRDSGRRSPRKSHGLQRTRWDHPPLNGQAGYWMSPHTGCHRVRFPWRTARTVRTGHHGPCLLRQREERTRASWAAQTDDTIDHVEATMTQFTFSASTRLIHTPAYLQEVRPPGFEPRTKGL